jgi:hypothetical protein
MSTSSGRDKRYGPCGHFLDGHAYTRDSKCKKCKKIFDICQVATHRGWRIYFIPCSCGEAYYPDKARAAVPLASHEYHPDHPGYRALTPVEDDYDTTDQASPSLAQGGDMGLARTDSTGSDPLGWSAERYQQETGSIDELVDKMQETRIEGGSVTAWSEWEWKEEQRQWRRYRVSNGKYEYEWQALDSSSSTSKPEADTAWSEWEWKEEQRQWRRYRVSNGKYEYEWQAPDSSTSSTSKPDTDWSEWELNEEHQRWCRGRWRKGKYIVEWDNPEPEEGKVSSRKKKSKK